jgi:hypothetical protein
MRKLETKTGPQTRPAPMPQPQQAPAIDPERKLNPDRLCPAQKPDIIRKIAGY